MLGKIRNIPGNGFCSFGRNAIYIFDHMLDLKASEYESLQQIISTTSDTKNQELVEMVKNEGQKIDYFLQFRLVIRLYADPDSQIHKYVR